MIRIVVYGIPQPAGSKRAFVRGGRALIVDDAKGSRPWKNAVTAEAARATDGQPLLEGALELDILFVVPRPKGHYGARGLRPSAPPYPTTRPDVLKLARAVEDALTGICWRDDAQIVTEQLAKRYGEPARCEIRIRPVEAVPEEGAHDLHQLTLHERKEVA